MGPLIDEDSFNNMQAALEKAKSMGGKVTGGERVLMDKYPKAYYVTPAIVEFDEQNDVARTETFAPILYVMTYKDFDDALEMQNDVPQGLSSCVFTNDLREAEIFLSDRGSDCGIANVNIGTSGAEIGGAFGGEKKRAVAVSPDQMLGRTICAVRPTPSIIQLSCHLLKVLISVNTK